MSDGNNKVILIDTESNEFLMDSMRIWNEYSSTYRDSGDDGVNRSKTLRKGIIEGIRLAVNKYNLNNTSPQPNNENYKRAVWESLEIAIQHAKVADNPFEFLVNQIQAMQNTEFSVKGWT